MSEREVLRFAKDSSLRLDDAIPVEAYSILLIDPEGRAMFDVRIGEDGKSIEVQSVDYAKLNGVLYGNRLRVSPMSRNTIKISVAPIKEDA